MIGDNFFNLILMLIIITTNVLFIAIARIGLGPSSVCHNPIIYIYLCVYMYVWIYIYILKTPKSLIYFYKHVPMAFIWFHHHFLQPLISFLYGLNIFINFSKICKLSCLLYSCHFEIFQKMFWYSNVTGFIKSEIFLFSLIILIFI